MPTYEYVCRECGHQLEAVQAFSDPALTVCPNCNGELKKVYGNVGIVFKGSGFYKTDSRGSASSAASAGTAKSDSMSSTSETTSTTSTTESTPATTSASTSPAASTSGNSSGS